MTLGVGGSTITTQLDGLSNMRGSAAPISVAERCVRIERARELMRAFGIDALYLDASTSLYYFTGLRLFPSERLHGAIIGPRGGIVYVCPAFEAAKTVDLMQVKGEVVTWEEHEDPCAVVLETIRAVSPGARVVGVDEITPFFTFDGLRRCGAGIAFVNGSSVTGGCRRTKSSQELALLQAAKDITLEAHRATARILTEGISTTEVAEFIAQAHKRLGADGDLSFCIVLFGEPTAYPHGVAYPQQLKTGDMVLIDTGATVQGYHSDITRTYVFGEPNARQREVWDVEKTAQAAAFAAAQLGATCESVDAAARQVIEGAGFGPGYKVPGLPHRTGHGIGLDVHEWSYLVRGDTTILTSGMCFSNEPMICIYGEFGVRLEDHFFMTEGGPRWFTEPSHSVDDPFGYEAG